MSKRQLSERERKEHLSLDRAVDVLVLPDSTSG